MESHSVRTALLFPRMHMLDKMSIYGSLELFAIFKKMNNILRELF